MPIAESPLVPGLHASSPPGASSAKWELLLSLNVVWEGWFSVSSTFLDITAFWQQQGRSAKCRPGARLEQGERGGTGPQSADLIEPG